MGFKKIITTSSSSATTNRGSLPFPFIYNSIEYDLDNMPYRVSNEYPTDKGSYCARVMTIYPVSDYSIPVIDRGTGSVARYKRGYPLLLQDKSTVSNIEVTNISGRFKLKSTSLPAYTSDLTFATISINVAINDINYRYLTFPCGLDWVVTSSGWSPDNYFTVGAGNIYPTVSGLTVTPSNDYILFNTSLESNAVKTNYYNMVWDFGETPQEVPLAFYNWVYNAFEPIYPYSYTIKNFTGDEVLGSIIEAPNMTKALLSTVGNQKTLTLTGSNEQLYEIQWVSETPEGQIFLGLSTSPNSNRPTLLANTESGISWVGDLVFYESYGKYRPPATTFDINLFQNSAEVNRVDKGNYLVGVGTLSGALRDECSMLTPSIVYQSADVPTFNYVYIPIFNRYYFVTSLSSVSKNVWRMELNCDVLMSYKNEILLLQGVVGRQEIDFNPMLVDSELPTQDNPEVEIVNIPSTAFKSHTNVGANFYNFVLTVIG